MEQAMLWLPATKILEKDFGWGPGCRGAEDILWSFMLRSLEMNLSELVANIGVQT